MSGCKTCDLTAVRDAGNAPIWDFIHRGNYWDVAHAYNTSLPGWLVLVARRHVEAIDALTADEAFELGGLQRSVSHALKRALGCLKTYVMQFAEAPGHAHVHFHIVPRMPDQPVDKRGPKIFGYLGVPDADCVSTACMNEIGLRLRQLIQLNP